MLVCFGDTGTCCHTEIEGVDQTFCSNNCTCCHTVTEVVNKTFYLTQSQYTDKGPTSPSNDPITRGACQVATKVPFSSPWYA